MTLTWERTVIGGDTLHYDFVAKAGGIVVGRIIMQKNPPHTGKWDWSFQLGASEFRHLDMNGTELTKQEAADKIRIAFVTFLDYPSDKGGGAGLHPEDWPPRQNSYAKARGK
jgi:hypothetical protein